MGTERPTIDGVRASRSVDTDAFRERAREEGEAIKEHLAEGTFDSVQSTIGLEHELYAVDADRGGVRRVPRSLLRCRGFERELGLHNAELTSDVQPCSEAGLAALRQGATAKLRSLQRLAAEEGIRFVSDGTWTVGPADGSTERYLTEATHEDGLVLAINVSNAVRYHGFASVDEHRPVTGSVELPGATVAADNAGPVSLTTSIQPHLQPRRAADLPAYHGAALRVAGPLLAVAANSPFLPPTLYDEGAPTRELLLGGSHAETRVPLYEGLMNPPECEPKVAFPRDLDDAAAAVDRVVADPVVVPADIEGGERFDDAFVHFRHKHGSYWRWVRPVFDGATEAAASARIEFRPLPGQPTLPDAVACVAAVVGLLTELADGDHPAAGLPWETARANFYAAVRDGIDADLTWITATGDRTADRDRLFADVFAAAVAGLEARGLSSEAARSRIAPLRRRAETGRTPARWKRRVAERALDAGDSPADAVRASQRAYVRTQATTLFDGHFVDWPDGAVAADRA